MATKTLATLAITFAAALALAGGCKDDHGHSHDVKPAATQPDTAKADGGGHHGNATLLGETTSNGLKFKAMQDAPVKAGGEGAFDLIITGYPAGGKPKAVRFWVGTDTAYGSTKALASEESPDNWHTHAEVPNPIPAGSKFWAEIEPATGEKFKVSFDMK